MTTKTKKKAAKKTSSKSKKSFSKMSLLAKHAGFDVDTKLKVENSTIKMIAEAKKDKKYFDDNFLTMEEAGQILVDYKDSDAGTAPIFKYYDEPSVGKHQKQRKRSGEDQVSLHIVGVNGSIADALMIKTIHMMLKESGYKNVTLLINNVGGKEAQTQFNREATSFFRKHISILNATCRQYFKEGVHTLITEGGDDCRILKEHAPATMDFLGEETRAKFRELIEYIEDSGMNYEICNDILGDTNYSTHTTFQMIDDDSGKVLAAGSRYNLLYKKLGSRKETPALSANVWVKSAKNPKNITEKKLEKADGSKFFMIQVGEKAKMKALKIIEEMYNAGIYVKHRIVRDKLSSQLQFAAKIKAEYMIIIGHKEALDGTAIVKDHSGKSQKIIKTEDLARHLKTLK